jgi:hypothetical protein
MLRRSLQEPDIDIVEKAKGLITPQTRYIVLYTYDDNKCEDLIMAELHPLNTCAPSKKGGFIKYFAFVHPTNKHIEMTKSYFSDSQCATKATSSTKTISSSVCARIDSRDEAPFYVKGKITSKPTDLKDLKWLE